MLNQDFKEFIVILNANDVRYLVVGGYAVGFHGSPRYTKDIDIWIESSQENANKILIALSQFGFGSLGLKVEDFVIPDMVIQLGYAPVRIDLLTSLAGVNFTDCFKRRVIEKVSDVNVNFIDLESLIINKRVSGRHQDLADVEKLMERSKE
jgi:hypothetical protein